MSGFDLFALPKGLTAIVGGGGKTTLMTRLAQHYSKNARVIVTTSTHIMKPDFCEFLLSPAISDIEAALKRNSLIAVGSYIAEGKLTACDIPWETLSKLCDCIIVEADGAKRRPLKAPAAHEPVLPENTALTIAVAGMDGADGQISDFAHRPELYAEIVGKAVSDTVTPDDIAKVLTSERGQRKNVKSRFMVVLNKADTPKRLKYACEAADRIDYETIIAALEADDPIIERREAKI